MVQRVGVVLVVLMMKNPDVVILLLKPVTHQILKTSSHKILVCHPFCVNHSIFFYGSGVRINLLVLDTGILTYG